MKYIDTNIFIFALTGNTKAKALLQSIADQKIRACTSALTWDEFVWILKKQLKRDDITQESKKFLYFPNLIFLSITSETLIKAHDLLAKYALKPRDALHAAVALENSIHEFVSEDPDFDIVKELKRTRLS